MKVRMKKGIAVFLTALMVLSMAVQSMAAPISSMKPAGAEPAKITGTWSKDAAGSWHFNAQDGAAKDGWYYLNTTNKATDYNWFCFDANGVMRTGWVQDKADPSVWYYTGESKGSGEGGLVKGWITDPQDGKRYYLDPETGAMYHGWKQIGGLWYYFGEGRDSDRIWTPDANGYWKAAATGRHSYGSLYVNEWTPDGYYVGSDGAWIRNYSENDNSDTPDPAPKTYYTVTFDMQGHGTQIDPINDVVSGSTISAPTPAPTTEGYTFGGWYKEAECTTAWNFNTDTVAADMTLYAQWTADPTVIPPVVLDKGGKIKTGDKEIKIKNSEGGEQSLEPEQTQALAETINEMLKNEAVAALKDTNLAKATKINDNEGLKAIINALKGQTRDTKAKENIDDKTANDIDLQIKVELSGVNVDNKESLVITYMEFEVTPIATVTVQNQEGETVSISTEIKNLEDNAKFRLPIGNGVTEKYVAVYHEDTFHGNYEVKKDEKGYLFIEIESSNFSKYGYQIVNENNAGAKIGDTFYFKFEDAVASVKNNETITLLKPANPAKDIVIGEAIAFQVVKNGKNYTDKIKASDGYTLSSSEPVDEIIKYSITVSTWGVIGDFSGWAADVPMTEKESNVFVSPAIAFTKNNQFKVRYGAAWDINYGASEAPEPYVITSGVAVDVMEDGWNLAVPTDGEYTVTLNLNNNTITVTAVVVPVAGVTLDKGEITLQVGDEDVKLIATVAPENATNKNVSWSSNNTDVATVDNAGNVHAVAAGEATITVTTVDGNKTDTCAVKVTAPAPETYTVTFDLNGATGTAPTAQTIKSGSKVTKPDDPEFANHTFAGWYKTKDATTGVLSDPWNFDTDVVTDNTTLYAQWTTLISRIVGTNGNIPTWSADEDFDWNHPDLENIPNNAWVAEGGQKAFWDPGEEGGFAMLYMKKISDDDTEVFVSGPDDTDVFIKVGNKYVCTNDFGTYTCTMNAGVFTSLTFEGNDLTEYDMPDFSLLNGTYAAPAKYMDWDADKKELVEKTIPADAIDVTNDTTSLQGGKFYIVNGTDVQTGTLTVTGDGAPTLILMDDAKLTATGSDDNYAGIDVASGNALIITGQKNGTGILVAKGNYYAAGIGDGQNSAGGSVTINGGTVTAKGGPGGGAGIGGGKYGAGGTVTINGGTVQATGSSNGAGIGGGTRGAGGTVTINGGNVTANGGESGAGIGGGYSTGGVGGTVTINGGTVQATGGSGAAGIGGGNGNNGGSVTINGGTVQATGGSNGAGIGGGNNKDGGSVTINGGTVQATGGSNAAGIGGGSYGNGGSVTINGGTVTATGKNGGEAIGKGTGPKTSGTLTFGEGVNFTINAGADKDHTEPKTTAEYSSNHSAAYVSIKESAPETKKLLKASGTSFDPVNDAPMAETEVSEPTAEVFEPEFEPEKFEEAKPEELIEPAEAVAEEAAP